MVYEIIRAMRADNIPVNTIERWSVERKYLNPTKCDTLLLWYDRIDVQGAWGMPRRFIKSLRRAGVVMRTQHKDRKG